jgi:SAM-dependent methyltransferase
LLSARLRQAWDLQYENHPTWTPDWERLPLDDLKHFIEYCDLDPAKLGSLLDVGCGTGLRTFALLLGIPELNHKRVRYQGIDLSAKAIARAEEHLKALQRGQVPEPLVRYVGSQPPPPEFHAEFRIEDLLEMAVPAPDERYDLVVDWMCFHDTDPLHRRAHADKLAALCGRFLVLKVFSGDGPQQVKSLGKVGGVIQKHRFSRTHIEEIFKKDFEFLNSYPDAEELNPHPPHSDGPVAAKMAYLMLRRP